MKLRDIWAIVGIILIILILSVECHLSSIRAKEDVYVGEGVFDVMDLLDIPAGLEINEDGELSVSVTENILQNDYEVGEYTYGYSPARPNLEGLDYYNVTGTVYNLTVAQCDSDPFTPACPGYTLSEEIASTYEYIAISANLLDRNTPGGPFSCGERVWVEGMNPQILDGFKIICDVAGSHRNWVDFLVPRTMTSGLSYDVRIYKLEDVE